MLESKLLNINHDKSNFLIIGAKKARDKLKEEAERNPLKLGLHKLKEVEEIKFLGDYLCNSLGEAVHKTVMKRLGMAKQAIYEIRTVVEDKRARSIGGINLAFDLWSSSVIPMILYNGETWTEVLPKTFKVLNDLFLSFLHITFRIGTGCPKVILFWDSASWKAHHHLIQMKLLFIYHLHHLHLR